MGIILYIIAWVLDPFLSILSFIAVTIKYAKSRGFLKVTNIAFSQHIAKIGFDPKLAINGAYSYDNTPVLDAQLTLLTQLNNGFEAGITLEYANLNPTYYHYGIVLNKSLAEVGKFKALIGIEGLIMFRDFRAPKRQLWITSGVNAELRYNLFKNFGVALKYNYKYRPDFNIFKQNGTIEIFTIF